MAQNASPLVAAVMRELGKYPSLDARAVLAIAAHEGLSGGIGDQGTSFGPFQLHKGGAFPSGVAGDPQQWAWSPSGIDYALSRIQGVAGGLKGMPAIEAISRRFERPANPSAEIADAAAKYGLPVTGGSAVQSGTPAMGAMPAAPAQPHPRAQVAHALLAALSPTGQINAGGVLQMIQAGGGA